MGVGNGIIAETGVHMASCQLKLTKNEQGIKHIDYHFKNIIPMC